MTQNQAYRLQWSDRFEVGVETLDADHRELVRLINAACCAAEGGRRSELMAILDRTMSFAAEHFQREEAVLRTIPNGERNLVSHAKGHKRDLEQIAKLRRSVDSGDRMGNVEQFCGSLIDWFVRQAIGHDARIRSYFHSNR